MHALAYYYLVVLKSAFNFPLQPFLKRCAALQACLGVSRKQMGADRFGDVVKTGSSSALACVTLWNVVRALAPACICCRLRGGAP